MSRLGLRLCNAVRCIKPYIGSPIWEVSTWKNVCKCSANKTLPVGCAQLLIETILINSHCTISHLCFFVQFRYSKRRYIFDVKLLFVTALVKQSSWPPNWHIFVLRKLSQFFPRERVCIGWELVRSRRLWELCKLTDLLHCLMLVRLASFICRLFQYVSTFAFLSVCV